MIHMHQLTQLADDRAQITHSRAAWDGLRRYLGCRADRRLGARSP
jgi:hypothetical protein